MGMVYDLIKEAHKHPFFSLLVAFTLAFWIPFSMSHFAIAEDTTRSISDNTKILSSIKIDMKKNSLENEIRYIESEMFGLESALDKGEATDREVKRLSDLKSDFGRVSRELQTIYNMTPSM